MINRITGRLAVVAYATLLSAFAGNAQLRSKSGSIVVLAPSNLPEAARTSGDNLFLHATAKDEYLLYVEEQNGSQLVIFDVSDPAHIKVKSAEPLKVTGPFDFVRPLGNNAELLRFRDGKSVGVLDLSHALHPELHAAPSIGELNHAIVLDEDVSSGTDEPYRYVPAVPHDFKVIDDTSKTGDPELITTVPAIEHEVTNQYTGTTFLLGANGLTVVRRIPLEQRFDADKRQQRANW